MPLLNVDLAAKALNIFYPPHCIFCDEIMNYDTLYCVCAECQPITDNNLTIDGCYQHIGLVRDSILRLKFANCTDYAETMGNIMAAQILLRYDIENIDVIVPMPSGPKRMKKRGYNQAELLAKAISKQLNTPLDTKTLTKPTDTPPQSTLSAEKRQTSLKGKLVVSNKGSLKDQRIMLIDDVRTTGASLDEARRALLKHGGAKSVMCRTFAQTD